MLCVDNFFTGTRRTSRNCWRIRDFELMRHDVTFPLYVEVDRIFNLACPASPDPLPARPGADDEDERARRHQHARPREARSTPGSSRHRQARSTAIPRCIRSPRATGAGSIRSAPEVATTKASVAPRPCSSTTTASIGSTSRSYGSSTLTARACTRTTAESSATSSSRRCKGEDITILRRRPSDPQLLLRGRPHRCDAAMM